MPSQHPNENLSNGYGLANSTVAEDALKRNLAARADRDAHRRTRNGRLIKAATVVTLLAAGATADSALADRSATPPTPVVGSPAKAPKPEGKGTYTVQPGDNLWDIARKIDRNLPGSQDVVATSQDLVDQNGGSSDVQPGTRLQVDSAADVNPDKAGVQLDRRAP